MKINQNERDWIKHSCLNLLETCKLGGGNVDIDNYFLFGYEHYDLIEAEEYVILIDLLQKIEQEELLERKDGWKRLKYS